MDMVGDYRADQLGIPAKRRTSQQEGKQMAQMQMQMAQQAMEAQGMTPPDGMEVPQE